MHNYFSNKQTSPKIKPNEIIKKKNNNKVDYLAFK